jgi:flavin-dependent dehydrogenase
VADKTKQIRIVGAGPSGLCAAINLARADYGVTVYERNDEVGRRFHGDFQGIENWSTPVDFRDALHTMSIAPNFFCRPYSGGEFRMRGGYGGAVTSPQPLFYLTLRGPMEGSLDRSLKAQALDAGVTLKFGCRRDPGDGHIIAAGPGKPNVMASGLVFRTDLPDTAMAVLHNGIAPGGYAYLLVQDGRATLASVYYRNFKGATEHLERTTRYFQSGRSFSMEGTRGFTGYGNFYPVRSAVHRGRLYVGEAAGFQDFLFGFGIRYALTSGYLAARSIIEGRPYDLLWREVFGRQLATSLANRYLLQRFGPLAHRLIIWRTTRGNPWAFMNRFYNSTAARFLAHAPAAHWLKKTAGGDSRPWPARTASPNRNRCGMHPTA